MQSTWIRVSVFSKVADQIPETFLKMNFLPGIFQGTCSNSIHLYRFLKDLGEPLVTNIFRQVFLQIIFSFSNVPGLQRCSISEGCLPDAGQLWLSYATPKFWCAASGWQEFLLQLTVEKMRVFEVFTKKYLQRYGCNDNNFTALINCTNLKTEIQGKFIVKYKTKIKFSS